MPALLQEAYTGKSPAAFVSWSGGVGAPHVPIPLRGGGAPNMSVITPGLVAKRIAEFNKSRINSLKPRANTSKLRANTSNPPANNQSIKQPTSTSTQNLRPQGNGTYFGNYMRHPNLVSGGYRSRKQRRRPTRKAHRKAHRKTRRVQRKQKRSSRK